MRGIGNIIAWQEKPDRQAIEKFLERFGKGRGWKPDPVEIENTIKISDCISCKYFSFDWLISG